jgi:acyl-CoA reductase-like NAD-dependent aldehyde dehydrogenase
LFIGDEWQGALDDRTFEKTNPFTGEIFARFSSAGRKDARCRLEGCATPLLLPDRWRTRPGACYSSLT